MSDARKAYFAYRHYHPQSTDISVDEFTEIYRMGGRHALSASADFVELVPKLRELIWWFEAISADVDLSEVNA